MFLGDGETATVARAEGAQMLGLRFVDATHVYFMASEADPPGLYRAPLQTPGPPQLVRESSGGYSLGAVRTYDRDLYWVEDDRLLRMRLPED